MSVFYGPPRSSANVFRFVAKPDKVGDRYRWSGL